MDINYCLNLNSELNLQMFSIGSNQSPMSKNGNQFGEN